MSHKKDARLIRVNQHKIPSTREYDQEIPQSLTADKPIASEEEPYNNHQTPGRQTKQSKKLSRPHQDYYKTRIDIKYGITNIEQLQNPTMGVTLNNESTTTEPSL